jgi:transposase
MQTIVGIDISKETFDVDFNGKGCHYDNNEKGIKNFIKSIPGKSSCVMESTSTYGDILAWSLHETGHDVYIVNPTRIKNYARMKLSKVKTDKKDARIIREFAEICISDLLPYNFPSENILIAKQIETALGQLIVQRTATKNQLEAVSKLKNASKKVIKSLEKIIEFQTKQIEELQEEEKKEIDKDHKQMREQITSIKGIGDSTACMLIALTNGFKNFQNAKQLSSYFGCCPRVCSSGSSVKGRGSISKIGLSDVRTRLYMCALSAKRYNLACKDLFERLIQKGKPFKVALMAVVNKLIRQIFAVISKNEFYNANYEKKLAF